MQKSQTRMAGHEAHGWHSVTYIATQHCTSCTAHNTEPKPRQIHTHHLQRRGMNDIVSIQNIHKQGECAWAQLDCNTHIHLTRNTLSHYGLDKDAINNIKCMLGWTSSTTRVVASFCSPTSLSGVSFCSFKNVHIATLFRPSSKLSRRCKSASVIITVDIFSTMLIICSPVQALSLSLSDASRLSLVYGMNALARNHNYFETARAFALTFAPEAVHYHTNNTFLGRYIVAWRAITVINDLLS